MSIAAKGGAALRFKYVASSRDALIVALGSHNADPKTTRQVEDVFAHLDDARVRVGWR